MATLIKTDGTKQIVHPANKRKFTYDELIELIGGNCELLEWVSFYDGRTMFLDDFGKFNGQPFNLEASKEFLSALGTVDPIMGNVVILSEKECNYRLK